MSAGNPRPRRSGPHHWVRWLVGAVVGVVVLASLAVAGTFIYIHFVAGKAPAPFSLSTKASGSQSAAPSAPASGNPSAAAASLAGTWTVAGGSQAGYRVNEVLFGQQNTAVGRTSAVSGHLTIAGQAATAGTFSVAMATVRSDQSQRDVQFNGRIMDTSSYPTATFTLTRPISLDPMPAAGATKTYTAQGNLTLRGKTRPVTFKLTAEHAANTIKLSGSIPVTFATWDIPNPSFGPITTQNHGSVEFLLNLGRS
jgi:polyisoprenoid-binding protein YceI